MMARVLLILALYLNAVTAFGSDADEDMFWEYELDAYYSNVSLYINLTDEPIPHLGDVSEAEIYSDLLLRSHRPRFMLVEASVYPLPAFGAWFKHDYPETYDDAFVTDNVNLIRVLTAGFEEPYALSLFLGNMVTYGDEKNKQEKNEGFMGYLLSVGNRHLINNDVIHDDWIEFEWKIKGNIVTEKRNLDWSFRIGGKWHEHPSITDSVYVGIRRDHLDFEKSLFSFLHNSGVDFFLAFDQADLTPTQQKLSIHKNIPVRASYVFKITGGLIRTTGRGYKAPLFDEADVQLFIAPSISF